MVGGGLCDTPDDVSVPFVSGVGGHLHRVVAVVLECVWGGGSMVGR